MALDLTNIINDFVKIANLAEIAISRRDIRTECLKAPHVPPCAIPAGSMAVYVFLWDNQCLKVGKVGAKSHARYTAHHYSQSSSQSNLSKSILKDKEIVQSCDLNEKNVGDWIKKHTDRVNFIIDARYGMPIVTLLEAYLQCRLKPKYEGFESQK